MTALSTAKAEAAPAEIAFVLDDEPAVGTAICHALRGSGMVAQQFCAPAEFLAALKARPPELIALDLALGQTDAIAVIRELGAIGYTGRILLISGHDAGTLSEVERIGAARGLRMLPSLRKPFRMVEIKERLLAPVHLPPAAEPAVAETPERPLPADLTLANALANGWVELWYQPKVSLPNFAVYGAEALMRVRHPTYGIAGPKGLLPAAGDPLFATLTSFVLERAMQDWTALAERGLLLKLSLNVPASLLQEDSFVDQVRRSLPADPRFPGLVIEVTEDEVISDPDWMREAALQLRLFNASIAIDDFGSAYASLSRLSALPFSEIKLDRPFVTGCSTDRLKQAVVRTTIDLAHSFGATLCAEGVETREDVQCLVRLGCDAAQGYFFAKPMPVDTLAATLLAG